MLSCWHDLLFLFCLLLFYLFLPSIGWLCGVGVFGLIEYSHSLPALHSGLQIIIIIVKICFSTVYRDRLMSPPLEEQALLHVLLQVQEAIPLGGTNSTSLCYIIGSILRFGVVLKLKGPRYDPGLANYDYRTMVANNLGS